MSSSKHNQHPRTDLEIDGVLKLANQVFPQINHESPVLGVTDDVIIANNLKELLQEPSTVLSTAANSEGAIVGFSMAVPIGEMDPTRQDESNDTAYIYYVGVHPLYRRLKIAADVNRDMDNKLRSGGYSFTEIDAAIDNGFADKISQNYAPAIVTSHDHEGYEGFGFERFFRIDLSKLPA